ncbi:PhzF family phenazine biosynthesis protein [Ruminococcaceae bacterium OttesenSCG-928-L11]|nr:PhzF family phenazine biosynthesis protein [Ruminococcaceae bacterium OttesenSCG-928-L11]
MVDAFTDQVFKGNQAGVCLLEHALSIFICCVLGIVGFAICTYETYFRKK